MTAACRLERHDPGTDTHRFMEVTIGHRDPMGWYVATRTGDVGRKGKLAEAPFGQCLAAAEAAMQAKVADMVAAGWSVVTEPEYTLLYFDLSWRDMTADLTALNKAVEWVGEFLDGFARFQGLLPRVMDDALLLYRTAEEPQKYPLDSIERGSFLTHGLDGDLPARLLLMRLTQKGLVKACDAEAEIRDGFPETYGPAEAPAVRHDQLASAWKVVGFSWWDLAPDVWARDAEMRIKDSPLWHLSRARKGRVDASVSPFAF